MLGFPADAHCAVAAEAAHERTSAVVINNTRSAAAKAVSAAGVGCRATSQTTVTPARLPASITAANGGELMLFPAGSPENARLQESRLTP
jgi:hypothetical protein